jgi:antitoxin (DNA-binding transcriptional repressor) of toxin-antitoxin stability system
MYDTMMKSSMTVSEARAALPDLVERVQAGDEVTLTRHGVPVAVVVRPDALNVRRANAAVAAAANVRELLDRGRRTSLSAVPTLGADRAEAMVAEIRDGRRRR